MIDSNSFRKRRNLFLDYLDDRAAIIPAAELVTHHADCEYPFRQNSDFWYLTGFDEPEAIALFLPYKPKSERFVLFVLPKDSVLEVWQGVRSGTEGAIDHYGADISHPLSEFPNLIGEYLKGSKGIVFRIGKHPKIEEIVLKTWADQLNSYSRVGSAALSISAPCSYLHKMRLVKDLEEIERMREASVISAEAHELARKSTKPGMNERFIQGIIEQHFLSKNTRGPAYGSIVAGGDNACVLHYTSNNDLLRDGDLLLIDAGCSLNDYYNGDITRTFPINGRFTSAQRDLYQIVLEAQMAAIDIAITGNSTEEIHLKALKIMVEGLIELGLLIGNSESIIEKGDYRHLYMHKTGHWLGLDVHDVGAYRMGDYEVKLEAGMVLTVEPGLYISDRIPVPDGQPEIEDRWKGIGIRIEDNILVDDYCPEVLSIKALKSIEDMEQK